MLGALPLRCYSTSLYERTHASMHLSLGERNARMNLFGLIMQTCCLATLFTGCPSLQGKHRVQIVSPRFADREDVH